MLLQVSKNTYMQKYTYILYILKIQLFYVLFVARELLIYYIKYSQYFYFYKTIFLKKFLLFLILIFIVSITFFLSF